MYAYSYKKNVWKKEIFFTCFYTSIGKVIESINIIRYSYYVILKKKLSNHMQNTFNAQ